MRYIFTLLFIFLSGQLAFGQVDSIRIKTALTQIENHCRFERKGNTYYFEQIGATFAYVALARGWFMSNGDCPRETYLSEMIENKFYLDTGETLIKYKNGRPYSGRIKESDGHYVLLGRCKHGMLHGKVIVRDNHKNTLWNGKLKKGMYAEKQH